MVGAFSALGSSTMDVGAPFLCLDSGLKAKTSLKNGGDLAFNRDSVAKKHLGKLKSPVLRSSFVDSGQDWRLSSALVSRNLRKRGKNRKLMIVDELGGQYEDNFEDVKKDNFDSVGTVQTLNYFTFKAARTVLNQLYEMNPPKYMWFYNFLSMHKSLDGKRFIRMLCKEQNELAERVMITRLHLYGKWIKKCNHGEIYKEISEENLELMRERLMETVIWPSDDTTTEKIG